MGHIRTVFWNWLDETLSFFLVKLFHIKILENNWDSFMQFVKFGIVGLSNTLISYVSYLFFIFLECHYLVASVLSFIISVTNSFYWNNKYVFKERLGERRSWWQTYIKTFMAYALTGLILNNILLVLWVDILCISEIIAPLINLIVTIPLNYVINKYWAFRGNKKT